MQERQDRIPNQKGCFNAFSEKETVLKQPLKNSFPGFLASL